MRRKKTWLGLAAAVTAAGLLTSCAGAGPEENGKTVITFWQHQFDDTDNAWYAQQVAAFNESQDKLQVELVVIPDGAWDQRLKAAQGAGTTPDMYTMSHSTVQPKARNGELAPITDYLPADAWSDLTDSTLAAVTVGDEHYGYPLLIEPSAMLLYRTDLFDQVGLDGPPATWEELIADGEKLKAADVVPFQTGFTAVELRWSTWGLQMGAAGHLPISDDWSEARADDPQYEKLLQLYQDLYAQGIVAQQPLSSYGDVSPLGEGKLGMMANGSWAVSALLNNYPDMIDKLGLAPIPSFDGDATKPTATLGGWGLGVDAKSKHIEEAASVISWMLAGDTAIPYSYFEVTKFTKFSPRTSVAEKITAEADTSVNPWYDVMANDIVPYQILEPNYDVDVSVEFGLAIERAMLGGDVTESLAEAQKAIQRVIDTKGLAEMLAGD